MNDGDLGLGRARLQSPSPTLHTVHNSMHGNTPAQNQTGSRYHTTQYQQQASSATAMTRLLNLNQASSRTASSRGAANNNGVANDVAGCDGVGGTVGGVSESGALHPNLVNSLTAPIVRGCGASGGGGGGMSNARKRKTSDNSNEDIAARRQRISEHKAQRLMRLRDRYADSAMEMFFLESGGNLMDLHVWRKRPATPQLMSFLHKHRLDPDNRDEDLTQPLPPSQPLVAAATIPAAATPPAVVTRLSQQAGSPSNSDTVVNSSDRHASTNKLKLLATTKQQGPGRPPNPENAVISQEQIVEKAKQEAYVMQRIGELQREGLWGEKRLPKQHEPSRAKAHWDYLLEEMVWMAADFAQERKWKKVAAKKCARMVQKYFQDKEMMAQKAVKSREIQLKKIAGILAKEIKQFWSNAEKFVEFKQQTRLEEKRKKALDQHLSFIVDQTEKYSTLVAESMNKTDSVIHSRGSSRLPSPTGNAGSDLEFEPIGSSSDDEETIAKAEAEEMAEADGVEESAEIEMLEKESLLPLDELLKDYLDHRESIPLTPSSRSSSLSPEPPGEDDEFKVSDKDTSDDEETIQEQEKAEGKVDHKQELDTLKAEGEMSIEELMAMYSNMPSPSEIHTESDVDVTSDSGKPKDVKENGDMIEEFANSDDEEEEEEEDADDDETESDNDSKMIVDGESLSESIHSSEEDEEEEEEDEMDDEDGESQEPDLTQLVQDDSSSSQKEAKSQETTDKEINDVAALAESIQPTGNTLSSTSVVTKVPFLLKYPLREYQHIGLDWLVTMYERKLNGILADEMGLGKTIQTISLLAHLACEKGNWGPHLIVVPTSVMLNWEMELKKWCPAFKILTYYGSPKERRLKRTGWTKSNAFHICITSYKLVIQDHQSFRRKKWKYLILDEAQNIKNFKSQRWQLLLNFQTQRRLLLTGTPLQNNLMELWSLMHFLMPNVFQSHREFKEWFSNPVTGMIEGNSEYNENIIKRLHKVLRPFLLRRLKTEVEKQLPKKYEHVIMCRLSNRQRYLYDDFMSKAKTKETLATGNLLSVINVLMQLRKVCNHPNLFEVRPTVSPFQMPSIQFLTASMVWEALDLDPWKTVDLSFLNFNFIDLELCMAAFVAHRIKKFRVNPKLIEEIDSSPAPPPRCPVGKIKLHVKVSNNQTQVPGLIRQNLATNNNVNNNNNAVINSSKSTVATVAANSKLASPLVRTLISQGGAQGLTLRVPGTQIQGYSVQLVQHQGTVKAIPVAVTSNQQQQVVVASSTTPSTSTTTAEGSAAATPASGTTTAVTSQGTRLTVPAGFAQLVQTSTGKHVLFTSSPCVLPGTSTVMTTLTGQRLAVLSKQGSVARLAAPGIQQLSGTRPMVRLPTSLQNALLNSVSTTTTATGTVALATTSSTPAVTTSATVAAKSGGQQMVLTMAPVASAAATPTSSAAPGVVLTRQLTLQIRKKNQPETAVTSEFNIPSLEEKRKQCRCEKLASLAKINTRKCLAYPVYGEDLRSTLRFVEQPPPVDRRWSCTGYINCTLSKTRPNYWTDTDALASALLSVEERMRQLEDIINRFVVYVPAVVARSPQLHMSHPPVWKLQQERMRDDTMCAALRASSSCLHSVLSKMMTQFPDPRLIQYDCGKLQTLDRLLRRLKASHRRVLIFTQMTRMLDVLEAFLNYHGHIYLRLDGSTRVDQRQALMERFNADKRIFVFILTTRSGGIGVNLTGADTVIFYDSDWNPTMDAQAQDRCHRIGQTRDVHIYRLISEKTVEENILKKANQKRMLGDLAIEGGNFTTAYFKSSTIQELFNVDVSENDANTRMAEVLQRDAERKRNLGEEQPAVASGAAAAVDKSVDDNKMALGTLESAMATAEDESDVVAAKTAKAEAAAELAEFDESIPLEGEATEELSKAEQEVNALIQGMSKLEKYAMRFIEETDSAWSAEQLAAAEAEIELQKREWEKGRLAALKEEEQLRRKQVAETSAEEMLTYSGEDARQVWMALDHVEQMPLWCPPTPPQDEGDVYIDYALGYLYEHSVMLESELPPVYCKKERKRSRVDLVDGRPVKRLHHRDETSLMTAPKSLFDRPSPALLKVRHDLRLHKYRGGMRPSLSSSTSSFKPPQLKGSSDSDLQMTAEWSVHEDWTILQAVQQVQELPLGLAIISPGHLPNWHLVADIVNSCSRTYRSPKQCQERYEQVIVPREEGKLPLDPKKQKKTKNIYKITSINTTKCSRVRTASLFSQDNNLTYTRTMNTRFDMVRVVASKRMPMVKSVYVNSDVKNPKHAAILANCAIDYDMPLTPVEVAARRAERIARQKEAAAVEQQQQLQQQQQAQQQAQQQQAAQVQQQQLPPQQQQLALLRLQQAAAVGSGQQQQLTAVANVVAATTMATVQVTSSSPGGATRIARAPVKTLTVQDIVARATVSSPSQSPTSVATQRVATANLVTVAQPNSPITAKGKQLTPAQMQVYTQQLRQQQLRQLQAQAARAAAAGGGVAGGAVTVAVTSATVTPAASTPTRLQQVLKQQPGGVTRTVTENEVAALLKRQQVKAVVSGAVTAAVGSTGSVGGATTIKTISATTLTHQQLLAQAGLQAQQPQSTQQVTALVKTVPVPQTQVPVAGIAVPQVKVGTTVKTAAPQQIQRLTLTHQQLLASQRKLPQQKVTQLGQVMVAGKSGVPAQLIVQSQKAMPTTMTMQQIQQAIKQQQSPHLTHVAASGSTATVTGQAQQVLSHAVLTKAGQATVTGATRVIPVATTQQSIKQIQVVTAASQATGMRTATVSNVSIDSSGRPSVSLPGGLTGTIKVGSQQALLSQVSAALQQGQGITVRQGPMRLTTASGGSPLVAVAVSQATPTTMLTIPANQTTGEQTKVLPQLLSRNPPDQQE